LNDDDGLYDDEAAYDFESVDHRRDGHQGVRHQEAANRA